MLAYLSSKDIGGARNFFYAICNICLFIFVSLKNRAMRRVLSLCFVFIFFAAFSYFAWSHYKKVTTVTSGKTICSKKINKSNETIFELMVKHFIGLV